MLYAFGEPAFTGTGCLGLAGGGGAGLVACLILLYALGEPALTGTRCLELVGGGGLIGCVLPRFMSAL